MTTVRINELPPAVTMSPAMNLAVDSAAVQRATVQQVVDSGAPVASQAEAEAGVNNIKRMTPLTTKQAIGAQGATLFATAAQGVKADNAVQPSRTVSAGSGLTGGGALAANITLALSSTSLASLALANSAVQPSRQIVAGTGLAGGGNLSADRALALDAATIASLGKADNAVQPARTISAGAGLAGGGNLSADRSLSLNAASIASLAKADSAVQPARSISAGAGLAGGGNLSADRTLSLSTAAQASLTKADSALQAPGGLSGQVLTKNSNADNDVAWETIAAATAVSYGPQTLTAAQKTQALTNIGVTPFAQTLLDDPDQATARTTLGVAAANAPSWEIGAARGSDGNAFIDFHTTAVDVDYNARIIRNSGTNGAFTISNVGTGPIAIANSAGAVAITGTALTYNGRKIVESGTNANGEYTRWEDGTQICLRSAAVNITVPPQSYAQATGAIGWAATFSAIPRVYCAYQDSPLAFPSALGRTTTQAAQTFIANVFGSSLTFTGSMEILAIGRWY